MAVKFVQNNVKLSTQEKLAESETESGLKTFLETSQLAIFASCKLIKYLEKDVGQIKHIIRKHSAHHFRQKRRLGRGRLLLSQLV